MRGGNYNRQIAVSPCAFIVKRVLCRTGFDLLDLWAKNMPVCEGCERGATAANLQYSHTETVYYSAIVLWIYSAR